MATDFNKIAKDFVVPFWQGVIDDMRENLLAAGISGGSNILQSLGETLDFKVKKNGYTITLSMPDYYIFLDEGVAGSRRFGKNATKTDLRRNTGRFKFTNKMPPIDAIRRFQMNRGIVGRTKRGSRGSKSAQSELDSIAFAIAKSIQQRGLEQTDFYSDAVNDAMIARFQTQLADQIGEDIIINIDVT